MVAQSAQDYEGRIQFLTSPGQDNQDPMREFVKEFRWPNSVMHAVDTNGELCQHFKVRFRGAWIFVENVDENGTVQFQSPTHLPEKDVRANLDRLLQN